MSWSSIEKILKNKNNRPKIVSKAQDLKVPEFNMGILPI
jgi:hypothetical protein